MLKNGPKMAPKRVPKWAPEGRPRPPKGHMGALRATGRSRALLLKAAFVVGLVLPLGVFWVSFCCCSFVLYVFMCAFLVFVFCFYVVVFLFYAFVFAMFEDCLTVSRASKETCNMFQDVSEWFSWHAESYGMCWVCASRDGFL